MNFLSQNKRPVFLSLICLSRGLIGMREIADEQGGDIKEHRVVTVGKLLLTPPLGELDWIVLSARGWGVKRHAGCCVASVAPGTDLCATVWAQSLLQDLRIADGTRCMLIICGKHGEAKQRGCLSTAMLSVSVYIWSSGNHQVRRACRPSKPKCGNCFVVTLGTEIDLLLWDCASGYNIPVKLWSSPLTFQTHTKERSHFILQYTNKT